MTPFTKRESITSPVLSLRGLRERVRAIRPPTPREPRDRPPTRSTSAGGPRPARLYVGSGPSYLFDGTLAGSSTWSASVKSADWNLKNRTVGLLFAGDYRLVVDPDGLVRLEAPARIIRVEAIPDGFRVDLQLKAPLRPRPNPTPPPPSEVP